MKQKFIEFLKHEGLYDRFVSMLKFGLYTSIDHLIMNARSENYVKGIPWEDDKTVDWEHVEENWHIWTAEDDNRNSHIDFALYALASSDKMKNEIKKLGFPKLEMQLKILYEEWKK